MSDEWDDNDFGTEFLKFQELDIGLAQLYDSNTTVIFIEPFYDTLVSYTNSWNKKRKKMRVHKINRHINTPFDSDEVEFNDNLYLDMGARLFNCIREHAKKGTKYLRILKFTGNKSRFDVTYAATEYKLSKQKKLPTQKVKK